MIIDDIEREKFKNLSPVMQTAVKALLAAVESILGGDCDEGAVAQAVMTLDANSKGRYNDDDLVTYDRAMKILGITDRSKLKHILDVNGVEQVTIHNQKVGFPRSKVLAVKDKMRAAK